MQPQNGQALCDGVARRLAIWPFVANLVGVADVFLFLELALSPPKGQDIEGFPLLDVVTTAALFAIGAAVARPLGERRTRAALDWLPEERAATAEERRSVLRYPADVAALAFALWAGGAAFYAIVSPLFGHPLMHSFRVGTSILLGGATAAALTYLIAERALRPVFARALAGEPADALPRVGLRQRLVLAWALGSGVPLLGIALAPLGGGDVDREGLSAAMAVLGAQGLMGGAVFAVLAARSVVDPLDAVRDGLARVEDGDLSVMVPVDDGGEVGRLQAGFNRMVAGLRERQRLADLFGRHVGEQVARLAIERGVDLSGQQVEASVVFVDLVGSTALAQDRPPSEVVELLNRFFAVAVDAVAVEGGYVSRFEGDGAVCLFGAPVEQVDHASRALRAARALGARLAEREIAAGIGVSSGIVVAGNIGTPERCEYTVIGDPVNEAARLTELAKRLPGRVLASEASVARADVEAVHWAPDEECTLRGRSQPTLTYVPSPVRVLS